MGRLLMIAAALLLSANLVAAITVTRSPDGVTMNTGTTTDQAITALSVQDQSGNEDVWEQYKEFHPAATGLVATFSFPALTQSGSALTSLNVLVSYQGSTSDYVFWEFYLYDFVANQWVKIGDNTGAPDWAWILFNFAATGNLSRFIGPNGEFKMQLRTAVNFDVCLLDAIIVTFVFDDGPVDECATGTAQCDPNAACEDLTVGYRCTCNVGYSGDGTTCIDINECTAGTHDCHANADCTNTAGSFTCACKSGFTGDGKTACDDIDECAQSPNPCGSGECTNTPGSYSCVINECQAGTHNCDANADCEDLAVGFRCTCHAGYSGDGVTCTDVNECTAGGHNCNANADCTNLPGSFSCACRSGFTGNGITCVDINECDSDPCPEGQECTNTPGSYQCQGACSGSSCFKIGMKILVIAPRTTSATAEDDFPTLPVIRSALGGAGIPFDEYEALNTNNQPKTGSLNSILFDAQGNPKYYGFVTTTGRLARTPYADEGDGEYVSSFSTSQWAELHGYCETYGTRIVGGFSHPDLLPVSYTSISGTSSPTTLTYHSSAFPLGGGSIATTSSWTISDNSIWQWHATIPNSPDIDPLLMYSDNRMAGCIARYNGGLREEIHFFLEMPHWADFPYGVQNSWVHWLTKGYFVGLRRIYVLAQVDDLFLSTELWDPNTRSQGNVPYRCTTSDFQKLLAWQNDLNANLPTGSNVTISFAFNANGVYTDGGGPANDPLLAGVLSMRDEFLFLSHTFTHPFLDGMSYSASSLECSQNIDFTDTYLFPILTQREAYSPNGMVTPSISGLFDGTVLQALWDNGIHSVVGDNSRGELIPSNLYHAQITSTAVNGFNGMMIIPRWATWCLYNAARPNENSDEYNVITGESKSNAQLWADEASFFSSFLLAYRHDPFMFHQANIHAYNSNGDSLLSTWLDGVIGEVTRFTNFPIQTLKQDDLRRSFERRMARDSCNINASMYVENGSVARVGVTGSGCLAAITGLEPNPQLGLETDVYGPDLTMWVPTSATGSIIDMVSPPAW